jgi:energy-converting hydrogenase Eha subunit H
VSHQCPTQQLICFPGHAATYLGCLQVVATDNSRVMGWHFNLFLHLLGPVLTGISLSAVRAHVPLAGSCRVWLSNVILTLPWFGEK